MKFLNSFQDLIIKEYTDLLLEGKLIASKRFLDRIENVSDNKVGEFLHSQFLSGEDKGDLPQNVVDITDRDDIITFMSDKSFSKLFYPPNSEEIFSAKGRSETKIGRFVRSLSNQLGQKFTDKEIEDFVNVYKASDTKKDNFKLVSGKEIKKYYNVESYSRESGTLGSSCMRYDHCEDYFDIYTKNPNSCQMLVLFDNEDKSLIVGRALVWKIYKKELSEECSAEYFMDRIYTVKDSDVLKFRKFAESNGWIYRKRDSNENHFNCLVFVDKGKTIWGRLVSELRPGLKIDEYPYVDSMSFMKGRYISNVGLGKDQKLLCDTEGSYDICDTCQNTGKQTIHRCDECGGDGQTKCPKCKCKKCDGGYIKCKNCSDGTIQCVDCHGDGCIDCPDCDHGYNNCTKCNGDGSIDCKKCDGDGSLGLCKKCKGEPITCKICSGEGKYYRKWGTGKRLTNCQECGGEGTVIGTFTSSKESLNRCDCYQAESNYWGYKPIGMKPGESRGRNVGIEKCDECKGDGSYNCDQCDGDGNIMCKSCDDGTKDCIRCEGEGSWRCEVCDGEGGEDCDSCEDGILDIKCKCDDGLVKCQSCNGTGVPKINKIDCSECVGLVKSLEREIKSGDFNP